MNIIPGQVDSLTIGGRTFTNVKNLIVLNFLCDGTTNVRSTGRLTGTSSGYQVPAGKSLRIMAGRHVTTAGTVDRIGHCYTDNDIGWSAATAFTNPVFAMSGSATFNAISKTVTAGTAVEFTTNFVVPTGKYVGTQSDAASGSQIIQLFGYLE